MGLFAHINLDGEEWRDVVGFEQYYQVSNKGRVKSKKRVMSNGRIRQPALLTSTGSRYKGVAFTVNNRTYNKLIHRLVAEAFIPNPDNLPEVNHKDLDITNNCVENLEWVSASFNHNHGVANRSKNYSYRVKVVCLETYKLYDSISAAGRSVNADATQIIESIEAQRCCKGFTFVYADRMPEHPREYMEAAHAKYQTFHRRPNMKNSKKVRAVETDQIFDSIASAAKFYEVDTATISNRIKAGKAFDGITLEFVED